jgi:N-acetylneuraminic acid mutarotase
MKQKDTTPTWKMTLTATVITLLLIIASNAFAQSKSSPSHKEAWQLVTDNAEWSPRAGLQIVRLQNKLFVLGGRTPIQSPIPGASQIWGDVWQSNLKGSTWKKILTCETPGHWAPRAYFKALTKGQYMYVIGGQNFNPYGPSTFFNDVWRSRDGIHWKQMTENAPWTGRAGLTGVVFKNDIYIMGGSLNDDNIIVNGQPLRVYFNDVWKSTDGRNWELVTNNAPWEARSGMRVVIKNDYLYLMGGESGFTPAIPGTPPPYYNDVWRSKDGKDWELITLHAPWSARPGHELLVYKNHFVLFGGFNLDPAFPFSAQAFNPMDAWVSKDGKNWKKLPDAPWNALSPKDIKYDFHALVVPASHHFQMPAILTVGGDRETFDFLDMTNYLNVDHDVWRFYPFNNLHRPMHDRLKSHHTYFQKAYPNPFSNHCTLHYSLPQDGNVRITVYDYTGNAVKQLVHQLEKKGEHHYTWNGETDRGQKVKKGLYFIKLIYNGTTETSMVMVK